MITLHLGVIVQPYRAQSRRSSAMTTGDVAEILEAKYGVMNAFAKVHGADIAGALEVSLGGAMETMSGNATVSGYRRASDPWGSATQAIQQQFRDFINSREAENVGIPGTPTWAALLGVNHRLKHPYRKSNPRRPSFRDTGMYVNSFRSWMTDGST